MRRLTVYKNGQGYGPKRRPKIMPGDIRNLVSDDKTINKIIKAVQVPDDKAGGRCEFCDLNAGSTNTGHITCLCNAENLKSRRRHWPVSICTLKQSGEYSDGVFVVFKDLSKIMENL